MTRVILRRWGDVLHCAQGRRRPLLSRLLPSFGLVVESDATGVDAPACLHGRCLSCGSMSSGSAPDVVGKAVDNVVGALRESEGGVDASCWSFLWFYRLC